MASLRRFTHGFLGWNGLALRDSFRARVLELFPGLSFSVLMLLVLGTLAMALLLPNSGALSRWMPQKKLCLAVALSFVAIISMLLPESMPEFIYSNF